MAVKKVEEKILPNPELPREQCVEECSGCEMMFSDSNIGDVCIAYLNPKAIQRLGCAIQTNKITETDKKEKIRVGQQKQKKR